MQIKLVTMTSLFPLFILAAIGVSQTHQQFNPNTIIKLTNEYFALMQYFEDNAPVSLQNQTVTVQKYFPEW